MRKTLRPDVKQLLNALMREVLLGNTHLSIANGLRDADPGVLDIAGVFFGLTFTAHLEEAQMHAAKLFDTHRDSETIHTLLRTAEQNTSSSQTEVHKKCEWRFVPPNSGSLVLTAS